MATLRQVLVRRPWWLLGAIAVILLMAATMVLIRSQSSDAPQIQLPSLDKAQPAAQPVQQAPEVVAPVIKEWPKVEVVWSEPFPLKSLTDLPSSLSAGGGFYRETPNGPASATSSEKAQAYLKKIMPGFLPEDARHWPVIAGVARDPAYPEVVLAGFEVVYANPDLRVGEKAESYSFLFLSVDGEKSWYEISSVVHEPWMDFSLDVRVVRDGDSVTLLAVESALAGPKWRKATLSLKDLP